MENVQRLQSALQRGDSRLDAAAVKLLAELCESIEAQSNAKMGPGKKSEIALIGIEASSVLFLALYARVGSNSQNNVLAKPMMEEAAKHFVDFLSAWEGHQGKMGNSGEVSTSIENHDVLQKILMKCTGEGVKSGAAALLDRLGVVMEGEIEVAYN